MFLYVFGESDDFLAGFDHVRHRAELRLFSGWEGSVRIRKYFDSFTTRWSSFINPWPEKAIFL